MRLTELAHNIVKQVIVPGDIAIDATVGNGFDLLFLAQHAGPTGHVYGFDVQAEALRIARQKLDLSPSPDSFDANTQQNVQNMTLSTRVTLLCACHSTLRASIPTKHHGNVGAVMFNLGYLPHGDHQIVTHEKTTIAAIRQSMGLLRPNGVITIVAYPGHDGGRPEVDAIIEMMANSHDFPINWQESGARSDTATTPRLFVGHHHKSVEAAFCRD